MWDTWMLMGILKQKSENLIPREKNIKIGAKSLFRYKRWDGTDTGYGLDRNEGILSNPILRIMKNISKDTVKYFIKSTE